MRLLHTSDWHLGKSLYDFSLIEDQEHFLHWLGELIEAEHIDAVLLAGDIYDRPIPSAEAMRLYDSFLADTALRLGVPVLAAAGNHDSGARLEFAGRLTSASGYHIAGKIRAEIACVQLRDKHGPVFFHLLPYLYPAELRPLLPDAEIGSFDSAYRALMAHNLPHIDRCARNVLIGHGFFSHLTAAGERREMVVSDSEVQIGGMDIVDSSVFDGFCYVALGHLHAPQNAGSPTVRYSGSPLKYSLSEEKQRKLVIIAELDDIGGVTLKEVPVPAKRDLRTVRGAFGELMDSAWHTVKRFDDYVFAEITDAGAVYPMEKLRTLFPRLLGLRFPSEAREGGLPVPEIGGNRARISDEEMFRRFYADMRGEPMPSGLLDILREAIVNAQSAVREEVSEP